MCLLSNLSFPYKIINPPRHSSYLIQKKKKQHNTFPSLFSQVFNTNVFQCQSELTASGEMNEPDVNKTQARAFLLALHSACHIHTDGLSIVEQMT